MLHFEGRQDQCIRKEEGPWVRSRVLNAPCAISLLLMQQIENSNSTRRITSTRSDTISISSPRCYGRNGQRASKYPWEAIKTRSRNHSSAKNVKCCKNMPYNVFVSYSTKDIPDVNALRASLQFPEVNCFVSEYAVAAGTPLAPTIQNAIQNCDLFVLLWSKNAAGSEWVPQEIGIAHASRKPILPFVLEPNVSLPGFISGLRYVAAYQNPQQAGLMLREAVLRNALTKQSQQNTLGLLAIGGLLLWFFKSAK